MLEKSHLRRELRRQRAAIAPAQRLAAAWAITYYPQILQKLRKGRKVAFYIAVAGEFPTWPLIFLALRRGCEVYLPVTPKRGRRLSFVRLNEQSQWHRGKFNIPVPSHTQQCPVRDLDSVFVPLLGFVDSGLRLGQGGGYYDFTFAFRRLRQIYLRPNLIGVAFACQQLVELPREPWDLLLDAVVTEQGWLQTK